MINRTVGFYVGCALFLVFAAVATPFAGAQTGRNSSPGDKERQRLPENILIDREYRLRTINRGASNGGQVSEQNLYYTKERRVAKELLERLIVDERDHKEHEAFLKTPETGIFKLVQVSDCDLLQKRKEARECSMRNDAIVFNNADAFIFNERRLANRLEADISVFKDYLIAGDSDVQTIMVNLGEVSLDKIGLESEGVTFLRDFKPKTDIDGVRKQFELFSQGLWVGKYKYSKSSPLKLNNVYILRAVAYEGNINTPYRKPADLMIAMKLIRSDPDGSVTFVWKKLSANAAPQLNVTK